jgi:ribonuclease HI
MTPDSFDPSTPPAYAAAPLITERLPDAMDHAARVIAEITGCTAEQTQAIIAALIAGGWSPPNEPSPVAVVAAEVAAPRSLDDVPAGSVLTAHTDGACSGNPGPGGWSVVFSLEGTVVAEFSGGQAAATTNNRMELTAAREAIERAPLTAGVEIITDSKNVIGWLSGGWKRNDSKISSLCKEIDDLRARRTLAHGGAVTFRYVRGHNGDALNERADELATGAIERARRGAA